MSQGISRRGMVQILVGAGCLALAWYCGHRSSAWTSFPDPRRDALLAEDLVWNSGSGAGALTQSGQLPDLPMTSPAGQASLALPASGRSAEPDHHGLPRSGPMIVEPEFASLPPLATGSHNASLSETRQVYPRDEALVPIQPGSGPEPQPDRLTSFPGNPGNILLPATSAGTPVLAGPAAGRNGDAEGSGLQMVAGRRGRFGADDQQPFRVHVVRPGETLQSISNAYFGSSDYYLDIYVANQSLLSDPADVPIGASLKIPGLRD